MLVMSNKETFTVSLCKSEHAGYILYIPFIVLLNGNALKSAYKPQY